MAQPLSDQTGIDQHIAYIDIGEHTVIGVALLFAGLQADVLAQHQPFVIALRLFSKRLAMLRGIHAEVANPGAVGQLDGVTVEHHGDRSSKRRRGEKGKRRKGEKKNGEKAKRRKGEKKNGEKAKRRKGEKVSGWLASAHASPSRSVASLVAS